MMVVFLVWLVDLEEWTGGWDGLHSFGLENEVVEWLWIDIPRLCTVDRL